MLIAAAIPSKQKGRNIFAAGLYGAAALWTVVMLLVFNEDHLVTVTNLLSKHAGWPLGWLIIGAVWAIPAFAIVMLGSFLVRSNRSEGPTSPGQE